MTDFFIFYLFSNMVCLAIFGLFLYHDLRGVDRQERQIKFDHALVAFMLYFISDSFWAAITAGLLTANRLTLSIINMANFVIMATVTYMWLRYVMAVEQVPNRERPLNKIAILFPLLVSTVALFILFIFAPQVLFELEAKDHATKLTYNLFLLIVPSIYIAAVNIYTMRRAKNESNPLERRRHVYIGIFPLLVIVGGIVQLTWLPNVPVYCFCCVLLMLTLYLQSMETQISLDPLTKLNNRVQLMRYVSQSGNLYIEGRQTYVMMLDVNRFKSINDTYGHAEGDRALTFVADALKQAVGNRDVPSFIGRYGGDEFVIIVYPATEAELTEMVNTIRTHIGNACRQNARPYQLSVSVGYDQLLRGNDTFGKCLQRADAKLYLDKEYGKLGAGGTPDGKDR